MALNQLLSSFDWTDRRNIYIATTIPLVTLGLISAAHTLWPRKQPRSIILPSPRKSLQLLTATQTSQVPYPPDALPGGRDVPTPYGTIRVYEWGPETGRKVLCIHGISTPAISFAGLAKRLVDEQGCRVMTFDLFGRGYSDAPDPKIYRQDIQLFSSQIFFALGSSELSWMGGKERFSLVGYSLGGGIAVNFTSFFPRLVESLVLIAPAGLIREKHISGVSKLLYGEVLPEVVIEYLVRRRLTGGHPHTSGKEEKKGVRDAVQAEVPAEEEEEKKAEHPAHMPNSNAQIFPGRPGISVADTVRWQTEVHEGFLRCFVSSIKFAPILNQHERWRLIASRQEAAKASAEPEDARQALRERKVLMLLGRDDKVIVSDEVEEDAIAVMGAEHVKAVQLEGAHDVPIVNAEGCAQAIADFWASSS